MTDLWILALGFGVLPLWALVLYAFPEVLRRHEPAVWGLLIGAVGFLGPAHAGATLLEGNAFLRYEANPVASALVAAAGLIAGIALGWRFLGKASAGGATNLSAVLWAALAFVAIHSFTDGLVLGEAYAGPLAVGYPLTLEVVGGTVLHRFAEGAIVLVPALFASWKPPKSLALPLVGLLTIPAAYIPVAILAPAGFSAMNVALDQAVSVFGAGFEAGFALLFLLIGLLPQVRSSKEARWAAWAGIGFILLLLVHFLVE